MRQREATGKNGATGKGSTQRAGRVLNIRPRPEKWKRAEWKGRSGSKGNFRKGRHGSHRCNMRVAATALRVGAALGDWAVEHPESI